jgi:hypothetical protein
MFNNFRDEQFIFFLRVLLIEDAMTLLFETDTTETILASMAGIAVGEIRIVILTGMTGDEPVIRTDGKAVVAEFGARSGVDAAEIAIERIGEAVERGAVERVFAVFQVIPVIDIPAVIEIVTRHFLTIETVIVFDDFFADQALHPFSGQLNGPSVSRIQCCNFLLILLLGVRLVKNMIFFILQSHAPEAITASRAMHEEHRGRTIVAVTGETERMTLDAIDAFVAILRSIGVEAIITILRLPDDVAVHAVFVPDVPEDKIAIAAAVRHVAVIAVLAIDVHERDARNRAMEDCQLFEERTGEVQIDAITEAIPLVTPPFLQPINGERRSGVVDRENFLPREITRAMIEVEEIPEHQSPLPAASRTLRRLGNTDALVKLRLGGAEERERRAAEDTCFRHQ